MSLLIKKVNFNADLRLNENKQNLCQTPKM